MVDRCEHMKMIVASAIIRSYQPVAHLSNHVEERILAGNQQWVMYPFDPMWGKLGRAFRVS